MRVFVTGASGFVGSAVVPELIGAGHEVVGLARSDAAAAALAAAGAEVRRGDLTDLDSLRSGAAGVDGVVHLAFVHDFSNMAESGRTDLHAIEALGTELEGSDRPLVVTSGTGLIAPGRVATERDAADASAPGAHRAPSEALTLALADRGVRSSLVRLAASVHDEGDHGFVPVLIARAREKGVSGYAGDGANRWPAVHRRDAARLFRLALEHAPAGSVLHGVGDEGIPTRTIAETIARRLDIPAVSIPADDVARHFGWLGAFFAADIPASSALTRELLGWEPTHPGLVEDLDSSDYFSGS
jgi:nucleoside-diphosphate-sugar epimerase